MMGVYLRRALVCIGAGVVVASGAAGATETTCENTFSSTFEAIQKLVFEKDQCTNPVCHGADPGTGNGFLDLRPEVAYDNLVNKPSQTVPGWFRVFPGERDRSLLYLNL